MINQTLTLIATAGKEFNTHVLPSGNKVVRFTAEVQQFGSKHPLILHLDAWNERADRVTDTVKPGQRISVTGKFRFEQFTREVNGTPNTALKPAMTVVELVAAPEQRSKKTGAA